MFTGTNTPSGPLPTFGEARRALLERIAARLGKPAGALRGWQDYDPISVDEEAYHMSQGHSGARWAGD